MREEAINREFITLRLDESMAEAQARLEGEADGLAIILDEDSRPVTVITAADLETLATAEGDELADVAGQLPPGVVVDAASDLDTFVHSDEFTAIAAGARGAIVVEGDELGILTEDALADHLVRTPLVGKLKGMPSDTRLPGRIIDKPIIVYCSAFNHRNELAFFDRHNPPDCQTEIPHIHPIR